jgi:hypothetical protein
MSRKTFNLSRAGAGLTALAATALLVAALAAPAGAATGSGNAVIVPAKHSKGRTLSGQGVKLLAGNGASGQAGKLTLPIGAVDPDAQASAKSSGELRFKKGKKTVALSGVHFNLSAGTLDGSLGGAKMAVFKFDANASVNSTAGSISLSEGALRLTGDAAKALKQKLGLSKALNAKGAGMLWLAAQAFPAHAAARPVVSGNLEWGVLASWRSYVIKDSPAPGPSDAGEITLDDGATATGDLVEAGSRIVFPALSGTYERGLYGAADKLTLSTAGNVDFAKPMHCINEVLFSGIELKLDGAASSLLLDAHDQIDKFNGAACEAQPPASFADVSFAALSPGSGTLSNGGNTVSWSAIPASLTTSGSTAWGVGPPYIAGKALDAVTITVGLG